MVRTPPPLLNKVEKWILWYLATQPGEDIGMYTLPISIMPSQLIYILPKPFLDNINDITDTEKVMENLRLKGLVIWSAPNHYTISERGVLIFRKYVVDEIVDILNDSQKIKSVLKQMEENDDEVIIKDVKDIVKGVKDKAKDDASEYILNQMKKISSTVFGKLVSYLLGTEFI